MFFKTLLSVIIVSMSFGAFAGSIGSLKRVKCGKTYIDFRREKLWVEKVEYKMENIVIDDRFDAIHFNTEGSNINEAVYLVKLNNGYELHYKVDNYLNIDVKCNDTGIWDG